MWLFMSLFVVAACSTCNCRHWKCYCCNATAVAVVVGLAVVAVVVVVLGLVAAAVRRVWFGRRCF